MPTRPNRLVDVSLILGLLFSLAVIGGGIFLGAREQVWSVLAIGVATLAVVLIGAAIAKVLESSAAATASNFDEKLGSIAERLQQFSIVLNVMSEQQLLSDRAKTVAFRVKERDTLRRAIQEEMGHGDFEAAAALANDIESSFGLKQEADRFRQDISTRRAEIVRRQINDAAAVIDRHCRAEQWQQATREAERLAPIIPSRRAGTKSACGN